MGWLDISGNNMPCPQLIQCCLHVHRYLIAKESSGKPVGCSHFRFDLDESIEVLYWLVVDCHNVIIQYSCALTSFHEASKNVYDLIQTSTDS